MRVLHVLSGDLWAGAEAQAFTLLTSLQRVGELHVAAVLMNEGELAERLRTANIEVRVLPESSLSSFQIVLRLRKLISEWRPDIVHTHRTKEDILGSIANRFSINAPCLRTTHGAMEHPPRGVGQRLRRFADRWCGRRLQLRIIAVSEELARKLGDEFPREKIVTIENGVDIDGIRSRVQAVDFRESDPNSLHVGIVGRLVAVKRIDLFLETARALQTQGPELRWRFHVFGEGPLGDTLERQASELGIRGAVTFHGMRKDITPCIAGLDALVICSDHEGLPMVLLEALATSTLVVARGLGGIRKVLETSGCGVIVERHDPGAYAEALLGALASGDRRASVPGESFSRMYSSARNAERIHTLYRSVGKP